MKNKKGSEKYLSIWWFFCLAIVLTGTVVALSRFKTSYDVAFVDGNALANQVLDCIIQDGKLVFNVSEINKVDVLSLCKIRFRDGKDYFIALELYDYEECEKLEKNEEKKLECYYTRKPVVFKSQNPKIDLNDRCMNLEGVIATYMPPCAYKAVYTEQESRKYILRVIGGTYEH
jgi:hypothetical protein